MKCEKPNIIFILADQHNANFLENKGNIYLKTPNLSRLSSEGVTFNNAITQNPICTPSRISWLSGQYCHNHGYYGLSGPNPEGLPNIIGHFRRNGYLTAAIGKIHCPEYWVEDDCDKYLDSCGTSIEGRKEYEKFLMDNSVLDIEDHNFIYDLNGKKVRQSMEGIMSNLPYEESQEAWIVKNSIDFMEYSNKNKNPFFIHVSLPRPHQCTTPSKPFWDLYKDIEIDMPINFDYEMNNKAPNLLEMSKKWKEGDWILFGKKDFKDACVRKIKGYLGAISQIDYAVGQILEWIDINNLSEDTIVIYSSDHGEYVCEHGIVEKAPGISSDAVTRIPMIWRWKGKLKENICVDELVEAVDMPSTLCSLAKIEPLLTSDGKDITSLLLGKEKTIHRIAVTELAWSKSIRMGDYRLIYYPKEMFSEEYPDGFMELYNIKEDPFEMNNLYFDENYKDIVNEIKSEFLDWLITTTRIKTVFPFSEIKEDENSYQWKRRYLNYVNNDGKISPDRIKDIGKQNNNYI